MRFVAIVAIVLMAVLVVGACAKKPIPTAEPGSSEAEARKAQLPPAITEKAGAPEPLRPELAAPRPAAPAPMAPMPGKGPGGAKPLVPGPG